MGNTESNVTSGVKKQAGGALQPLYKLVDLKGQFSNLCLIFRNFNEAPKILILLI